MGQRLVGSESGVGVREIERERDRSLFSSLPSPSLFPRSRSVPVLFPPLLLVAGNTRRKHRRGLQPDSACRSRRSRLKQHARRPRSRAISFLGANSGLICSAKRNFHHRHKRHRSRFDHRPHAHAAGQPTRPSSAWNAARQSEGQRPAQGRAQRGQGGRGASQPVCPRIGTTSPPLRKPSR